MHDLKLLFEIAMVSPDESRANRVLVLSMPRSASNLLETMLSKQPTHDISGYTNLHWVGPWMDDVEKGPFESISADELEKRSTQLQNNYECLLEKMEKTERDVGLSLQCPVLGKRFRADVSFRRAAKRSTKNMSLSR